MNSTIRQAVAEQTRAEESLEALRRDLGVRVHKEYRGVSEGVMRVRALEQAVRSAQQMLMSTQMSLKAGSRTQLDVLNAQQQYTLALRDLAQARLIYLMSKVKLASLRCNFSTRYRWFSMKLSLRILARFISNTPAL